MIDLDASVVWEFVCSSIGCELNGVAVVVLTDEVECGGCNTTTRKGDTPRLESGE